MSRKQFLLGWLVVALLSMMTFGETEWTKPPYKGDFKTWKPIPPDDLSGLPEGFPTIRIAPDSTAYEYLHSFDREPQAAGATPQYCPDIDGDDFVNLIDLAQLAGNWLETGYGVPGDFDWSGQVDADDLALMGAYWLTDPECEDHYSDSLPYLTSFEEYQGYYTTSQTPLSLDFQMGWNVEQGVTQIWKWLAAVEIPGMSTFGAPYQFAAIAIASTVSKSFDDQGTDHSYVRVHLIPAINMEVKVMNGDDAIAAVLFDDSGYIHVLDNGSYVASSTFYGYDYDYSWTYFGYTYNYDDVWLDLTFKLDFASDTYEVSWAGVGDPNIVMEADFDTDYEVLTDIRFDTTTEDWGVVNRVSVSDFASGDWINEIAQPCACDDELDLQGRLPLKGTMWAENFGYYDVYFCPADVDAGDIENWVKFDGGAQLKVTDGLLAYWDTGVIPNGTYYLGLVRFNDLGYPEGLPDGWFNIVFKEVYIENMKIYEGPAYYPVTGDLKGNTFYHSEEPDISIPWPGKFPFELKRSFNNNRRFYNQPYRNGWTDNNQLTLVEDSSYYFERETEGFWENYPSWDEEMIAFGMIYVTYPDGGRKMFRHTEGSYGEGYWGEAKYHPYPEDGSEDYIVRTVQVDDYIDQEIERMQYILYTRNGEHMEFDSGTLHIPYNPVNYTGNLFGQVASVVTSRADLYGNTLSYSWTANKTAVEEISYGSGAAARHIKYYDYDDDDRYDEVRLVVGTDYNNPLRVVKYEWTPGDTSYYRVRHYNTGVDAGGDWQTDPNMVSAITTYSYDAGRNLWGIAYADDPNGMNISDDPNQILIDYDGLGRVNVRLDFVEEENYLATGYGYQYYRHDPNNPDVFDLRTIESTAYQASSLLQSYKGALLEHLVWVNDDCAVKNSTYAYTDAQNPLAPTEIHEFFDGRGKSTYLSYNSLGNLTCQRVDDDADQPVYTDYTWHSAYDMPLSQSSWQQTNRSGQKVQTVYVYGLADGSIDTVNPENNKYLVQEKVLLAEDPNDFAVTSYKYHANGQVSEKVDPANHRTEYQYDAYGYPQWVRVGPEGYEEAVGRYLYDALGQKVLEANAPGGVTLHDYDNNGRLYRVRTYDDPCALTIADGSFIVSRYTALTAWTDTSYGYDRKGNRTWEKKTDIGATIGGVVQTTYTLNNLPDVQTIKEWDSGASSYITIATVDNDYDDRGLKVAQFREDIVSGKDWLSTYAYDALGRGTDTVWYDDDEVAILRRLMRDYNGLDKVAEEKLYGYNLERHTTYDYDLFGRVTERVVDPANLAMTTTMIYDSVGNRTKIVDPEGNWIYTAYDRANRQTTEYFAAVVDTTIGNATPRKVTVYNDDNSIFSVTDYDYDGSTVLAYTEFDYDDRSRIKQVSEDIDGVNVAVTDYNYSDTGFGSGNAYHVRITDAEDKDTWRALDAFGRLTKVLYPSGDYEEMLYYGDGSLWQKAVWDAQSQKDWIEYTYDGFGRLRETTYPDNGTVTHSYDGFGRRILVEDGRNATDNIGGSGIWVNTIAYEYDVLNRVSRVTEQDGYTLSYNWRGDGQKGMVSVSAPGDPNNVLYGVDYVYDTAGRLAHVFEPELGLGGFVASLGYDDNGNREALSYYLTGDIFGSTMDISYSYNRDNLLTGFSTTGGSTFSFDADASGDIDGLGRLVSGTETITKVGGATASHVLSYGYDRRSELLSASMSNIGGTTWTGSYDYLMDGNLDSRTILGQGTSFGYTGDLMTGLGGNNLTWNDNGNLTAGLSATYVWNWDRRLQSATLGADSQAAKYTPDGVRIWRQTVINSTTTTRKLIVDATGDYPVVLLEIDPSNSQIVKTFIHANGQILMQHDGDMEDDRYFYLHDRLGSVCELINSSGTVVNHYTYDPFGNAISGEVSENLASPYRFAGYYWEPVVGQYFCNTRWYDPLLARFTGRDPVMGDFQEPMTLHAYLYCLNNPINATDPTGMVTKEETVVATGTATSLGAAAGPQAMSILQNARAFVDMLNQRAAVYGQTITSAASRGAQSLRSWTTAMNRLGMEIHHIVGKGWGNVQRFGSEIINSAENLIAIDKGWHGQITSFMNSGWRVHTFMKEMGITQGTLQQYISGLSFADQWRWSASILMHLATNGNLTSFDPKMYGL